MNALAKETVTRTRGKVPSLNEVVNGEFYKACDVMCDIELCADVCI